MSFITTALEFFHARKWLAEILLFAVIGGGLYWAHTYLIDEGIAQERAVWKAKEAVDLAQYNDELLKLTQEAREKELAAAARQAAADKTYQENIDHANQAFNSALARLHAGTLVLRDPAAASVQTGAGEAGATPGAIGSSDGGTKGGLSRQSSEFLLSLATDADNLAHQLADCQAIVISDRAQQ